MNRKISLPRRAPNCVGRRSFVHSIDDRIVAFEESLASAAAWPGAPCACSTSVPSPRPRVVATATEFEDGLRLGEVREPEVRENALIESGAIRTVVDRVFPFESTNAAMAYVETGRAKGKVVVRVR